MRSGRSSLNESMITGKSRLVEKSPGDRAIAGTVNEAGSLRHDAPTLVMADVGIAIRAGTDVAVEAGDVVVVQSDPWDIPRIVALSRASYRRIVPNLWWASGYNIVAIPLAAGVLARAGILLSRRWGPCSCHSTR